MIDVLIHLSYFVAGAIVGALSQQICGKQITTWLAGVRKKIGIVIANDSIRPTDPPPRP